MANKRKRVTIRLTKPYVDCINELIDIGIYNTTNEAIRTAIRMLFEHHGINLLKKIEIQET